MYTVVSKTGEIRERFLDGIVEDLIATSVELLKDYSYGNVVKVIDQEGNCREAYAYNCETKEYDEVCYY